MSSVTLVCNRAGNHALVAKLADALVPGTSAHRGVRVRLPPGARKMNRTGVPRNLELWSLAQPYGQRVEDKIAWAKWFIAQYGERTDQGSGVTANDCAANAVVFESPALLGG